VFSAAAFAVLCALVSGVLLTTTGAGIATAQPSPPESKNDLNKAPPSLDPNAPVPADGPRMKAPKEFAIPNPDRAIFAKIEDATEVASEEKNPSEYLAWYEFVVHAMKFSAADLEQYAARDLTVSELVELRQYFRLELLRFDGKLVCIRRLPAPKSFHDIKELYEARFVPINESPLNPVSIVFLDLPKEFAAVRDKPFREWMDVDSWVTAAGYYFKTMSVKGDQGNVNVPLLVGKSITPLPGEPKPGGDDPTVIDSSPRVFKFIRDETKMTRPNNQWETVAYDRVVMHANRFSREELEKHAREVRFADLFEPVRVDFRLKNVKMEGRLISLRQEPRVRPELKAAGINHLYEGWLVPANEPRGNPVCIHFTEPLEGVEPTGRVNVWVSFAGFSFKKMMYESAEPDPKNPSRNLNKYAPLIIGKGPIARRDPDSPTSMTWGVFLQAAIIGGVLLIVAGGGLAWWYRSGDRQAKASIDAARGRNPFDANPAPPVTG
jgi:hypothetical protein